MPGQPRGGVAPGRLRWGFVALIASAVYSMPLESSARSLVPATGTQWPYSAVIKARGASCARAAAALKWDEGHRYRSVLRLIGGCETQDGDQHIGRVGKIEEGASTLEGGALQGLAERFIGESAADQLPPPPPPNDVKNICEESYQDRPIGAHQFQAVDFVPDPPPQDDESRAGARQDWMDEYRRAPSGLDYRDASRERTEFRESSRERTERGGWGGEDAGRQDEGYRRGTRDWDTDERRDWREARRESGSGDERYRGGIWRDADRVGRRGDAGGGRMGYGRSREEYMDEPRRVEWQRYRGGERGPPRPYDAYEDERFGRRFEDRGAYREREADGRRWDGPEEGRRWEEPHAQRGYGGSPARWEDSRQRGYDGPGQRRGDRPPSLPRDERYPDPQKGEPVSLLVRNLDRRTGARTLRQVFARFGRINDAYIPRDYHSRRPRGFAFVEFLHYEDAKEALRAMDGRRVDGRKLELCFAQLSRKSASEMRDLPGRRREEESGGPRGRSGRWEELPERDTHDTRFGERGDMRLDEEQAERRTGPAFGRGQKRGDDAHDGGYFGRDEEHGSFPLKAFEYDPTRAPRGAEEDVDVDGPGEEDADDWRSLDGPSGLDAELVEGDAPLEKHEAEMDECGAQDEQGDESPLEPGKSIGGEGAVAELKEEFKKAVAAGETTSLPPEEKPGSQNVTECVEEAAAPEQDEQDAAKNVTRGAEVGAQTEEHGQVPAAQEPQEGRTRSESGSGRGRGRGGRRSQSRGKS